MANNLDEGELVKKAQEWGSKLWEILAKEGGGIRIGPLLGDHQDAETENK